MPGTFFLPLRVSEPDMHQGTCATHVSWCMRGSLTSGFLRSRWRGKRSRHSRRMRNPQFFVSGKRPTVLPPRASTMKSWQGVVCLLQGELLLREMRSVQWFAGGGGYRYISNMIIITSHNYIYISITISFKYDFNIKNRIWNNFKFTFVTNFLAPKPSVSSRSNIILVLSYRLSSSPACSLALEQTKSDLCDICEGVTRSTFS